MSERRPIPGYEGYEVSDTGNVYSITRSIKSGRGMPLRTLAGRQLKVFTDNLGYQKFHPSHNGKKKTLHVHNAVLLAFVGPRPDRCEGAHLDGNPSNNNIANLVWATKSENERHKVLHGTCVWGELAPGARLTKRQVRWMRARRGQFSYKELADFYGVHKSTIAHIMTGKTWKQLEAAKHD